MAGYGTCFNSELNRSGSNEKQRVGFMGETAPLVKAPTSWEALMISSGKESLSQMFNGKTWGE